MILYNSKFMIKKVILLFIVFHLSYNSEAIMRLDYQILLKLAPLKLLAGSDLGTENI